MNCAKSEKETIIMINENKGMVYDSDSQYQALEQACEHLGMDSHIVVIKS